MRSLQARLGIGLLLSLVVLFAIFWLVVSPSVRSLAENHIASRLRHDGETLLSMLQVDAQGRISIDHARVALVYKRPFSGHYYEVLSKDQYLHSRSLWDYELKSPKIPAGQDTVYHVAGPQGQPLLVSVQQYRKTNETVKIIVAEDISVLEADIRMFQNTFTLTAGVLLASLIIIQVMIIRRGLRPLYRIRQELGELERGSLSRLTVRAPSEIQPMIQEINHLLDLMSKRLQRSRNALGDLAHALKKPLTVLTRLGDDEAVVSNPELHQSLTRQTTSMRQTIDHILIRARLAGEGPVCLAFDARTEIQSLIDTLNKMHSDKERVIETDIPAGLILHIDREDLLELMGNLLDNAFKWARKHIGLRVHSDDKSLYIEIEDDGPGIPAGQLQYLAQRGARMDEQIEGHGLGLAIAREIVTLYRGEMAFTKAKNYGGLGVRVVVPAS